MIQTEIEWLKEEWIPKEVKHHSNHNLGEDMSNEAFDEYQALQYGYQSYSDMITQMNKKNLELTCKFGDRYIQGWMK